MEQLDWGNPPRSLDSYLQHSLDARLRWLDCTRAELGKTVQVEWPAERYYGLKLAIRAYVHLAGQMAHVQLHGLGQVEQVALDRLLSTAWQNRKVATRFRPADQAADAHPAWPLPEADFLIWLKEEQGRKAAHWLRTVLSDDHGGLRVFRPAHSAEEAKLRPCVDEPEDHRHLSEPYALVPIQSASPSSPRPLPHPHDPSWSTNPNHAGPGAASLLRECVNACSGGRNDLDTAAGSQSRE